MEKYNVGNTEKKNILKTERIFNHHKNNHN